MSKLLYIESSPRKERSASIAIANAFLNEYKQKHLHDEIEKIDLWELDMPPFDGDVIDAKYAIMHGKEHSPKQAQAWKTVENLIADFKSADKYVISMPMWNYSIPYVLKHYIDLIVQPGYTFSYSPSEGYKGLVKDKKIALIYARGGAYGAETGAQDLDLQTKYMETVLGFIGFDKIDSILIEPTLGSTEDKDKTLNKAKVQAIAIAKEF